MPTADLWEFAERTHPVYEREPGDTRWIAPPPGYRPAGYVPWMVSERVNTREPLLMTEEGHPSVTIRRDGVDGPTVQEVKLSTRYGEMLEDEDLAAVRQAATQWFEAMRALSRGTLTGSDLRSLGHPYGYGQPGNQNARWQQIKQGPRGADWLFKRGWHVKGVRGAVPPLSVVNYQSGHFYNSWEWTLEQTSAGVSLRFVNRAFYAWFLSHGSIRAMAHGPWGEASSRYLGQVQQTWRAAVQTALRRRRAQEAQFGEEESAVWQPQKLPSQILIEP
jgi:hypothetical protein